MECQRNEGWRCGFNAPRVFLGLCAILCLVVFTTCGVGGNGDGSSTEYLPDTQASALEQMRADSLIPLQFYFTNGIPEGVFMKIAVPSGLEDDEVVHALNFLETYKDFYGLTDPDSQLYLSKVKLYDDGDEEHLFFGQRHNDIPVYAGELAVHIMGGYVIGTNGRYLTEFPAYRSPSLDEDAAETAAVADTSCAGMQAAGVPQLMYFDRSLFDARVESDTRLAWRVSLRGWCDINGVGAAWQAFVDAVSGEALFYLSESPFDTPDKWFDIETANETLSDSCWNVLDETDDDWWFDEDGETIWYPGAGGDLHLDGQHAYDYAHAVYNYFHNTEGFGRHAWDGDEGQAEIMVHVGFAAPNAFYDSGCDHLTFDDGLVQRDVLAHEWTHGIEYFEDVLNYWGESGALDEHFSDFFGAMVDGDWQMGEDIPPSVNDGVPVSDQISIPLRDMSDPPAVDNQPDHMDNFWETSLDYGGVHFNCNIPNKFAYLITDGGTNNTYTMKGMGRSKAEKLYYKLLADVMIKNKSFMMLYLFSVAVAQNWADTKTYGFTAQDVCDVRNAWGSVGVAEVFADRDCDGELDIGDPDEDGDGTPNEDDNCPEISNPGQGDVDGDGDGDACDSDIDGDGKKNSADNCPWGANADQADANNNGVGDVCDDRDGDGILDADDNCPDIANADQTDTDKGSGGPDDGLGDVCDDDDDNDGVKDEVDNCPLVKNYWQEDDDGDALGNWCDNCPFVSNPDQTDCDEDGLGLACDSDELPLPGECGKAEWGTTMNRFVHPLDIVSLGDCMGCSNWLKPDFQINVSIELPRGNEARPVAIVDDKGNIVKKGIGGLQQTLRFKPKSKFHYIAPGSSAEVFKGIQYYLQIGAIEGGAMEGVEAQISVEESQ